MTTQPSPQPVERTPEETLALVYGVLSGKVRRIGDVPRG